MKWQAENPDKVNRRSARYQARRRELAKGNPSLQAHMRSVKRRHLMRIYGLTVDAFDQMAQEQNHRCAICACTPNRLFVDHDHSTGKVRSLLCRNCNTGLGMFQDSARIVDAAKQYLISHSDATDKGTYIEQCFTN